MRLVELLLSNGANVNAQNINKRTPLAVAAASGNENFTKEQKSYLT